MALHFFTFLQFCGLITATTLRPHRGLELAVYEPHGQGKGTRSCNLTVPSAEDWHNGRAESFRNWTDYNWKNYKQSKYSTFLDYLRGEFAPKAAPSALRCDGVGTCSIGSCENIAQDISPFDQQMAYYAFEQISNIHHTYQVIYQASSEAGEYFKSQHFKLVERFSHAPEIQQNEIARKQQQQMALSITTAVILTVLAAVAAQPWLKSIAEVVKVETETLINSAEAIASSAGSIASSGGSVASAAGSTAKLVKARWKLGLNIAEARKNAKNYKSSADIVTIGRLTTESVLGAISLVGNLYLAGNVVASLYLKPENIVDNVDKWFTNFFTDFSHDSLQRVWRDLYQIMDGKEDAGSASLPELLKSGAFIHHDKGMRERLTRDLERTYLVQAINILWGLDRAYIVDTNKQNNIACENDWRGARLSQVCLPEHPDRVYWLYTIDRSREKHKTMPAGVLEPAGFYSIQDWPESYYNITKQEIVRSSIWMQEHGLRKDLNQAMPVPSMDAPKAKYEPRSSGIFRLPICRNPNGEAISPVRGQHGSNYPCMCGDFEWKKGWSIEKDETPAFLTSAGFWDSKNWQTNCKSSNGCHRDKTRQINWPHPEVFNGAKPQMQHPYRTCVSLPRSAWIEEPGPVGEHWRWPIMPKFRAKTKQRRT